LGILPGLPAGLEDNELDDQYLLDVLPPRAGLDISSDDLMEELNYGGQDCLWIITLHPGNWVISPGQPGLLSLLGTLTCQLFLAAAASSPTTETGNHFASLTLSEQFESRFNH